MKQVRTRFAPSPTGIMHIGNVRAALLNYLFAKRTDGVFALRIEDTDQQRNIADGTQLIIKHLNWLHLTFQEGPGVQGPYAPYFQSERSDIYLKHLQALQAKNAVYACFCTPEELETRRNRQIAMKKPPRYERTCLKLTPTEVAAKKAAGISYIWRMKIDETQKISFNDMARGTLHFDLQHFSDFPLTREDGSFTFIFANCVDDCEMAITHVFRGEEHLSNTVNQTVLYQALGYQTPVFWHLPILCNQDGKKLSKRDRGFSLEDVQQQGYLPEAICNYLGILGTSFEQEIMSLDELAQAYKFDHLHGISQIRYDIEKLKWMNHKWIGRYTPAQLTQLCKPFLQQKYDLSGVSDETITTLITCIQKDMQTLDQAVTLLQFFFERPTIDFAQHASIADGATFAACRKIIADVAEQATVDQFLQQAKLTTRAANISDKVLYSTVRILLTGEPNGMQISDIFSCLGSEEFFNRLK